MLPLVNCISLHTFMAYLFIEHRCIRVETVTPEQEEGEPETVGDDPSIVNQGRHLCIFYPLFWIIKVYVSCLRMSYQTIYIYQCLLRTYLMHYQPCLEHYHLGEYACLGVTNYMLSHA